MKKFRKSPIAIVCYVFAAVFAAYFVATEVNTISTIYEYYAPYGVAPTVGEVVGYMVQQGMQPLAYAILVCMAGIILEAVRKLNPANWATDDEIADAKEAKKAAREAKKIAKGEAAKAAAEAEMADEDEQIKPEFAATVADESEDTVVFEDESAEPETTEAASVEFSEEPEAEQEHQEELSDEFSAVVVPEEVDENLATELKKAVDAAEAESR